MKKIVLAFLYVLSFSGAIKAQTPLLKISDDNRYLTTEDDKPFLWLGDTAWELIHRLSREEIITYLEDRKAKGFNVIQTVVLAELDGLKTPNVYGHLPLVDSDPTRINELYFEHVDFVIREAAQRGMYIGLLPTWGDKFNLRWGVGPEIFTSENALIFGKLLADRYLKHNNIIWILGGDRIPEKPEHYDVIRAMAKGIRNADTIHLITYHPMGGKRATEVVNESWLDLDMFQSGHDRRARVYDFISKSRNTAPARPVINGEPGYENAPNRFDPENYGWLDDSDVRTTAYHTMLSGAAGYTYGAHDIWQMYTIDRSPVSWVRTGWKEALRLPGSQQMLFMKQLMEKFPWQEMTSDQSLILNKNPEGESYQVSAIGNNKDFIIAYTPHGKPLKPDLSRVKTDKVNAFWFNPRSGDSVKIGEFSTSGTQEFKPWSVGKGSDFVLVITDVNSSYTLPSR